MVIPLYIAEDNTVRFRDAKLSSDGSYVNSGTMTWRLRNNDGLSMSTGSMSYVALSRGKWLGTIDKLIVADLTEGATYWVEITGDNGAGADLFRRIECVAQYHGEE